MGSQVQAPRFVILVTSLVTLQKALQEPHSLGTASWGVLGSAHGSLVPALGSTDEGSHKLHSAIMS